MTKSLALMTNTQQSTFFEIAARRIVSRQCSEEVPGTPGLNQGASPFVGVRIVEGRITDIVALNGTVRLDAGD